MTSVSRISPPAAPPWLLERTQLLERLREAMARRLTTVVAGAGYGKSTLLAAWAAGVGAAWYAVDPADAAALERLAGGVLRALRSRLPDLEVGLGPASGGARGPESDEARAEPVAAALAEAVEGALDEDLALVLDDVQDIRPGSAPARFLAALCRQAPERLHLVLGSREDPPFAIERLRGRGQVLEVTARDLALSPEEVGRLAASVLGPDAGSVRDDLYDLTGGWPAAVRLAVEALRGLEPPERAAALGVLQRPEGPLFRYLAEEALGREGRSVRDLLRTVAHLGPVTAELCGAVGLQSAREALAGLARRGLFVQGTEEGWYRLHALVAEFVAEAWPLAPDRLVAVRTRAAAWFEKQGRLEEALRLWAAAGEGGEVVRVLEAYGDEMLRAGAVEAVVRAARGVPAERRSALVEQIEGEARQVRGDWEGALACFRRAAGDGDRLPAGLAWRMGLIHYLRAELEESLAVYERGRLDGGRPADESLLLSWQATSHWLKGDRGTCRSLVRRALALADRTGDPRALAAAHTVLAMLASVAGEGPSSEEHSHLALEAAERAGDLLQVIRIRNNRASHFLDEGRYEEALEDLRACIHLAEVTGFSFFIALGRVNRAAARFHLGRLEEAIADYEAARVIYRRLGSRSVGYALRGLADVCLSRGDLAVARSCYEQALEMAEEAGDVQVLVPVLSGLARVVAAEDPEHAAALVDRALATEPGVAHVGALLTAGWVALRWGDRRAAAERAALAAEESRRRNDRAGLAESLELEVMSAPRPAALLPRLEEALGIWRSLRDSPGQTRAQLALATISPHPTARAMGARAEERLRSMGVRVAAAAEAAGLLGSLPRPEGPPVLLQTLGSFRVVREGRPVPTTEWQSKKARDLLKVLVARRGRSASREYLGEVLWPEEDPARVANRLSVALSVVRSILDPRREHDPDHFIAADKESVALDQSNLPVDVEVFLAEARSGLGLVRGGRTDEARAVLESAETAYTGDFLEEDPYEDFAGPLREEARAAYVAVARTLAQVTAEGGEQDAAVRYYLRVLERDPYDEPANLDLVACLARSGRHGEARRHYRTYVARMAELDVEPAPFPATG